MLTGQGQRKPPRSTTPSTWSSVCLLGAFLGVGLGCHLSWGPSVLLTGASSAQGNWPESSEGSLVEPGTFIVQVRRLGLALFAALLWLRPGWWWFLCLRGWPSLDGRPRTCLIPCAGLGTAEELPFACVSRPASPRGNSRGQVPGCTHVLLKQIVLYLCILGSFIPIRIRNIAIALFSVMWN